LSIAIEIDGKTYQARRVNLATVKKHEAFFRRYMDPKKAPEDVQLEDIMEMGKIIHECVVREEKDTTLDQILEGLDFESAPMVYMRLLAGSGFEAKGEAKPANSPT